MVSDFLKSQRGHVHIMSYCEEATYCKFSTESSGEKNSCDELTGLLFGPTVKCVNVKSLVFQLNSQPSSSF